MNCFATEVVPVVGGYLGKLRLPADAEARPILGAGGKPQIFPSQLAAREALDKHLIAWLNGNMRRSGTVLQARSEAEEAFRLPIVKQKGRTKAVEVVRL